MRKYTVREQSHTVYDSKDEFPDTMKFLDNWREGDIGDWVLTDDGCVIQILRTGSFARPAKKIKTLKYVGTCTAVSYTHLTLPTNREV